MRNIAVSLFSILLLGACSGSYQYDVYVYNGTGEDIEIEYKSINDRNGASTERILLRNGDNHRIISTNEILPEDGSKGMQAAHCKYVAEYLNAFIRDSIPSVIKWCDPAVKFEKTDIGQGEFYIRYNLNDFPIPKD